MNRAGAMCVAVVVLMTGGRAAWSQAKAPVNGVPAANQNSSPTGCVGCPTADQLRSAAATAQASPANQPAPKDGDLSLPGQTPSTYAQNRVGPPRNLENSLPYDLLLQNGRVMDAKNKVNRIADVAIKDGKIAAVSDHLDTAKALKTIDVSGLLVTPGLIDMHTHVYASTGEKSLAGDISVWPDPLTFREGVTTVVDAGSSGWRNFEDFKEHIIDRSATRVLAELNIVGAGMRGPLYEDNLADMDGEATGAMAKRYPGIVVGIKSAHYTGPEWTPYIEAIKAGTMANIPVMIDYGANRIERPLRELLTNYLRPGDIYTHAYSGYRGEQDTGTLRASEAIKAGRKRGIWFDSGNGSGSFRFAVAIPLIRDGFKPDSLSTDLHTTSMNGATKNLLNVMGEFMASGLTLEEAVADATWHPAQELKLNDLGSLSVGALADVAVLRIDHGKFGFSDSDNLRAIGDTRLTCEMTLRNGKIVYDLDAMSQDTWNDLSPKSDPQKASHWTNFPSKTLLPMQVTPTAK